MPITFMDGFEIYQSPGEMASRSGPQYWQPGAGNTLVPGRVAGQAVSIPAGDMLALRFREDTPQGFQPGGHPSQNCLHFALRIQAGCRFTVNLNIDDLWQASVVFGSDRSVTVSANGPLLRDNWITHADDNFKNDEWFYVQIKWFIVHGNDPDLGSYAPETMGILCRTDDADKQTDGNYADAEGEMRVQPTGEIRRGVNNVGFEAEGGAAALDDFVLTAPMDQSGWAFFFGLPMRVLALAPSGAPVSNALASGVESVVALGPMSPPAEYSPVVQVTAAYPAGQPGRVIEQSVRTGTARNAAAISPIAGFSICESVFIYDPTTGTNWEPTALAPGAVLAGWTAAVPLAGTRLILEVLYWPGDGGGTLPDNLPLPAFTPEPYVTPWTIRPDWKDGVTERLQWLTDVLISQDGAEQRRRLRQAPRRVIEARFTLLRDDRRLYDSYMAGPQAGAWRVPLWWERNRLVLPADATSRSLTFHFAGSEIAPGDTVMVVGDDPFTYDLALVSGVGDGGVVLATKLARSWPAGAAVYPTKRAVLIGTQSGTRRSDDAFEAALQFQVIEPNDFAAAALDAYQGVPVLPMAPDWATDTTMEHQRMLALFDNQTGVLVQRDTALRAFCVQQFYYTARGRDQMAALRSVLHYLAGRLRPAWVPTFMRDFDFVPGGQHAAGSDFVTVRRSGYADLGTVGPVGSHTGRSVLLIHFRDGTLALYAVAGYVLTDAASETIQLDRPLDRLASAATVLRMSFVQVMRQDQDEVTLLHVTDIDGATQMTTTFRSCDVVRRSDPYAVFDPGIMDPGGYQAGEVNVPTPTPDQSQGVPPGTAPVVVDPISLALTGGAG